MGGLGILLGGGTGGGTFCCDFSYPPASPASWSSSGVNCIPPWTWKGMEELGPDWCPVQNHLSPRQSCSSSDPGVLWDMGKSPSEGWLWFEGSLLTLQVLLQIVCPGTAAIGTCWGRLPALCFRLAVKSSPRGGCYGQHSRVLLWPLGTGGTSWGSGS